MKTPNRLRNAQLNCIGKLMAGVSHEFKNHLSIIRELSGLMGDLLHTLDPQRPETLDRCKSIISGIDDRICQAAETSSFLSGFAHRMDEPLSTFNANDITTEIVYLLKRFARQKNIDLRFLPAAEIPLLHSNPFQLQFTLFYLINRLMASLDKNSSIQISTAKNESGVTINLVSDGTLKNFRPENDNDLLQDTLQELQATLVFAEAQNSQLQYSLFLASLENSVV